MGSCDRKCLALLLRAPVALPQHGAARAFFLPRPDRKMDF